jgi:hypothetical protein
MHLITKLISPTSYVREQSLRKGWCYAAVLSVLAFSFAASGQDNDLTNLRITACHPGFGGIFKTGYWTPVTIELAGGAPGFQIEVELLVPDDDGVATAARTPRASPVVFDHRGLATTEIITKIGRSDAAFTVNLFADGRVVRSRTFVAGESGRSGSITAGLPANTELVLHIGSARLDLPNALRFPDPNAPDAKRSVVNVPRLAGLPTKWFGYDSVNWLVISTSDGQVMEELAGDPPQLAAFAEWVEMGGRLLILCAKNAPQLIAPEMPLAPLVPGKFQEMITIDTGRALEQFSGTSNPVVRPGESLALAVPRLATTVGRVEAAEANLPIVVRASRAFGMTVFAGVDLDAAPLDTWDGRPQFLRRLLLVEESTGESQAVAGRMITRRGYEDLAGALRNRLGREFIGVTVVPFGLVTILVLAYLALIGPIDYFLVKWLGRMEWTWLTFPTIILLVSCGAYALAHARKGNQQRLNQAELVDVDLASGRARGSVWASMYSPSASTYDVSLVPHWPDGTAVESPQVLLSWFGMPGGGLGGMSATSSLPTTSTSTYRYRSGRAMLSALPIETWSTKSLAGLWTARAPQLLTADLEVTEDEQLLRGTVRNDLGTDLDDVRLLYGTWGWRLGEVPAGRAVTVDDRVDPLKVRTLLTRSLRGPGGSASQGRGMFVPEQAEVDELLDVITFYKATGGRRFSQLTNRYQTHCDLSHLLDLGQAVLMARCDQTGSQIQSAESPLDGDGQQRWTMVRFVIPVRRE